MRVAVVTLAIAGALAITGARAAHAETIQDIVVSDNSKTTPDTVLLIAKISVGDEWTPEMKDQIEHYLATSGLFDEPQVFWEPVPGGVRVHILVKDKHSWIVAPALYDQPTNKGAGVGYGENNLFGLGQKLLIYAQIATGDSFFVGAWVIPSIAGSHFHAQLDTFLDDARNFEYAAPTAYLSNPVAIRESRINYLNAGLKFGVELWRGVKLDARLRAAYVRYTSATLADGATLDQVTTDPTATSVPKPGKEGWDVSNEYDFTIDRHANWYGVSTGYKLGLTYEHAVPALGSDFHYWLVGANVWRGWQVLERHNLVVKGSINAGHHLPFQQEFVTGGTTMRGWLNGQFRGDFRTLVNLEYSVPMFEIKGVGFRGLAFWDSAYTTFLSTDNPEREYLPGSAVRGLDGFKNSVGIGTRLFMRQIVIPLLGVDFGYGLESRDFQIYLAIGLTD